MNPDKRISCEEALEHPYFSDFHDVEEEFCVDKSFSIPNVEDRKFSMVELYNAAKVRGRTRIKERRTVHKVKKIHVISGEVGEELIWGKREEVFLKHKKENLFELSCHNVKYL